METHTNAVVLRTLTHGVVFWHLHDRRYERVINSRPGKIWLCAQLFFDKQACPQILSVSELLEEGRAIGTQWLAIGRRITGRGPSISKRPTTNGARQKLQSSEIRPKDAHGVVSRLSGQ